MSGNVLGKEAAFARPGNENFYASTGLTKREYFAGQILAGIVPLSYDPEQRAVTSEKVHDHARVAVALADALCNQLAKET